MTRAAVVAEEALAVAVVDRREVRLHLGALGVGDAGVGTARGGLAAAREIDAVLDGDGEVSGLEQLEVGEKVKVWGTQKGDGGVVAEEIEVRSSSSSPGGPEKVSFKGRVSSVSFSASSVHASPTGRRLTLVVAGRKVKTDSSTRFKWSDGTRLDPHEIVVGDRARVEGIKKSRHVLATRLVVDCR